MGIDLTGPSKKEELFTNQIKPVVESLGYGLYDLEYLPHQPLLRVYIYDSKTDSATIDDCIAIDRAINFDECDWVPENIVLEVSSPGLYRKLKTKEHMLMAVGKRVSCNINKSEFDALNQGNNNKKIKANKFFGILDRIDEENLFLEEESYGPIQVPFTCIKKLNMEPVI